MHFHNITYMATPLHKNPCPGGHKIYNFGKFLNCVNVFSLFRYYPHFAFDFCTIYIFCHSLKTKTKTSFSKIVISLALFNKIYFFERACYYVNEIIFFNYEIMFECLWWNIFILYDQLYIFFTQYLFGKIQSDNIYIICFF